MEESDWLEPLRESTRRIIAETEVIREETRGLKEQTRVLKEETAVIREETRAMRDKFLDLIFERLRKNSDK